METVNLNLAHRWYIGYDLGEVVPDHSSLSKIRERYGLEVFHHFFEHIIEMCIQAGLVWGEELYFDSTKVQANAAISAMVSRVEMEANHHLEQLFPKDLNGMSDSASFTSEMVSKYNGDRITGVRKPSYQRITDELVSLTDPDAAQRLPRSAYERSEAGSQSAGWVSLRLFIICCCVRTHDPTYHLIG